MPALPPKVPSADCFLAAVILIGGLQRLRYGVGVLLELFQGSFHGGGFVLQAASLGDFLHLFRFQVDPLQSAEQVCQRVGMGLPQISGACFLVVFVNLHNHAGEICHHQHNDVGVIGAKTFLAVVL